MNVGKFDRILRFVLGIVLIAAPFLSSHSVWNGAIATYGSVLVGIVFIATALFRFCPLYRIIGMNTCKM